MTPASRDLMDLVAGVGRHWGWMLGFAILTLIAGILIIIWPRETVVIAAVLLGAQLVVMALFNFVSAFATPGEHLWERSLIAVVAVIALLVGLYLLRHPFNTVIILGVLLGIFWIINGFVELFVALGYRGMPGRGLTVLTAVLSLVAGAIALWDPALSLIVLAWILGIWLIVLGVVYGAQALMVRGAARRASQLSRGTAVP
jgi:uncharacterized membrane protein HdeD (DUF308 family)